MIRFSKRISRKAGLPPGSLVHIGEKHAETVRVRFMAYTPDHVEERDLSAVEESLAHKDRDSVTWIHVDGIHDVDTVERLGRHFDIHPLVLEDIVNTNQRPKMEDYEDYLFLILKMITYNEAEKLLHVEQVGLIVGGKYVLSFQESDSPVFEPVRERLRKGRGRIRKAGPDYLAYALMDAVVDNYFIVLEKIGEDVEELEDEVIGNPVPQTVESIHTLKRELLLLRKSVWPLREAVASLEKRDSPLIQEKTGLFLRDLYDHTIQVIDTIETFRDMVSAMMDSYLSSLSNRMNEVMKVLTIIATLFIPLTFIAGIYGMNFKVMPELEWRYGYGIVWGVILLVAALMLFYFRKKKWL